MGEVDAASESSSLFRQQIPNKLHMILKKETVSANKIKKLTNIFTDIINYNFLFPNCKKNSHNHRLTVKHKHCPAPLVPFDQPLINCTKQISKEK